MKTKPYLDFYTKNNVSPVLNHCDPSFLKKREALYFQLGIVPHFLEGKSILEFGPGNGINSLFTYSQKPAKYILVDGNPKGLENCKKHFNEMYSSSIPGLEFHHNEIENFYTDQQFDLVICEGVIPHQKNPAKFVRRITPFVKKGGLLLFTTHDYISVFSEILRGFLGYLIVNQEQPFEKQLAFLVDFFQGHFQSLKSMNRTHKDWVIDSVLYTDWWKASPWFSIHEAMDELSCDFIFYKSSPNFQNDWRWYKDLSSSNPGDFNDFAKNKYMRNAHNFIDCRDVFKERDPSLNLQLVSKIKILRTTIAHYVDTPSLQLLNEFLYQLTEIEQMVRIFSPQTADSISCYLKSLKFFKEQNEIPPFEKFQNWWGRGMQFVTFLKMV